ncbi:FG-GAP-like repeat-containing protein [Novipirellula artificiosorum]|uniref:FG-GAP repeat protein n=1 Tax=Novipirellula artificiosorum TaxID=2528016 RepID=A0A5C6DCB1_9BACT|nr:FG-GAP-like repeat-containing protein [Novipirellula artificiosorum]TWU33865.1 FG-GAP repeat protein [Novipirellula artificiosorum]
MAYSKYAYGRSPFDRPFRWYDDSISYEFPGFADAVSRAKGRIVRRPKTRGGYFFNAIGDWRKGRLAWIHTSVRNESATYAVYFDLLRREEEPSRIPPRGWLGDGLPRCDRNGVTTMGADHSRVDLDDWNGDGLVDLVVGEHYGHVFWWPNVGTKQNPEFRFCRFMKNQDGQPLDAGLGAAVKVVDWDADGDLDLLLGGYVTGNMPMHVKPEECAQHEQTFLQFFD